jgi:hypothetical protein
MRYKSYKYMPNDMLELTYECPACHKDNSVTVNQYDFEMSCDTNTLIQNAFPDLSPAERELIQTGICNNCFVSATSER